MLSVHRGFVRDVESARRWEGEEEGKEGRSVCVPVGFAVRDRRPVQPVRPVRERVLVLCGSEVGASLEERLKDRVGLLVVVVHDVDEKVCVHEPRDERTGGRVGLVVLGPLTAQLVCLVLDVEQLALGYRRIWRGEWMRNYALYGYSPSMP